MNTEDMRGQSRIDYAKDKLRDFSLESDNHRTGLITYNHAAFVESPLSTDKDMMSTAIETTSTIDFLYANGSFAGVGLEKALERFFPKNDALQDRAKIIILISDGTDSNSRNADLNGTLNKLKDKNITVYTVGVGTKSGGTIPWVLDEDETRNVAFDNKDVISRLDEASLVNIAQKAGGKYFTIDNLSQLHQEIKNTKYGISPNLNSTTTAYVETYYIFSILSLGMLILFLFNIDDIKTKLRKKPK